MLVEYKPMYKYLGVIMNIGTYIKLILTKKNMTQEELARRSGIPKTHISQIINGVIGLQEVRARKIEKALDLPENDLVKLVEK